MASSFTGFLGRGVALFAPAVGHWCQKTVLFVWFQMLAASCTTPTCACDDGALLDQSSTHDLSSAGFHVLLALHSMTFARLVRLRLRLLCHFESQCHALLFIRPRLLVNVCTYCSYLVTRIMLSLL